MIPPTAINKQAPNLYDQEKTHPDCFFRLPLRDGWPSQPATKCRNRTSARHHIVRSRFLIFETEATARDCLIQRTNGSNQSDKSHSNLVAHLTASGEEPAISGSVQVLDTAPSVRACNSPSPNFGVSVPVRPPVAGVSPEWPELGVVRPTDLSHAKGGRVENGPPQLVAFLFCRDGLS
jgi:hypothetical protein